MEQPATNGLSELAAYEPPAKERQAFDQFRDEFDKFYRGESPPTSEVTTNHGSKPVGSGRPSNASSYGFKSNEEEEYMENMRLSGNFSSAQGSVKANGFSKTKPQLLESQNKLLAQELETLNEYDNICDLLVADDDSNIILTLPQFREYTFENMHKRSVAKKKKKEPEIKPKVKPEVP